jgi:hypothetical protein
MAGLILLLCVPSYRRDFLALFKQHRAAAVGLIALSKLLFSISEAITLYATLLAPVALVLLVSSFQPLFVFVLGIVLTLGIPGRHEDAAKGSGNWPHARRWLLDQQIRSDGPDSALPSRRKRSQWQPTTNVKATRASACGSLVWRTISRFAISFSRWPASGWQRPCLRWEFRSRNHCPCGRPRFQSRSRISSLRRWSWSRSNSLTAATSALSRSHLGRVDAAGVTLSARPQPCGADRNICSDVPALTTPAFKPSVAPLPLPKPAIACTS